MAKGGPSMPLALHQLSIRILHCASRVFLCEIPSKTLCKCRTIKSIQISHSNHIRVPYHSLGAQSVAHNIGLFTVSSDGHWSMARTIVSVTVDPIEDGVNGTTDYFTACRPMTECTIDLHGRLFALEDCLCVILTGCKGRETSTCPLTAILHDYAIIRLLDNDSRIYAIIVRSPREKF